MIKLNCKHCGKEILKFQSQVDSGEGKYCSKSCYTKSMIGIDLFALRNVAKAQKPRIRVMINCKVCNQEFETVPSKIGVRHYCSMKCCLYDHKPKIINLEYLRDSQSYKNWRMKIYKRDNFTCQSCGKIGNGIQAHHIINVVKNVKRIFDIDNGVTLCNNCHKLAHKSNKPKRKQGELLENLYEVISSRTKQECLEGSETKAYSQDLTMKPHEPPAQKCDDIVRANRRLLEAIDK